MTEAQAQPAGVLLVDKEKDWTSHDVVKFIRGFKLKKVGHCGTLDPNATGLLLIVINRATKLSNQLSGQDKVYQGTLALGIETDSQDAVGEVISEQPVEVTEEQVRQTFAGFIGPQKQIPPMVSAIKQNGRKLYQLAREGIEVEREARDIVIHDIKIDRIELPEVDFEVSCSKGTYIRTLCSDIGKELGCGGHLKELRRLGSGAFNIEQAVSMDSLKKWTRDDLFANMIPLEKALTYI